MSALPRLPCVLLLVATLGLAGCDGPGIDIAPPRSESMESDFSGEAMVRQADVVGAARPADGVGEAPDTRIEERRGYRLQFDEADALVAAYPQSGRR
ncbi:hypothetical protein M8009_15440 [Halomonas sp. ATCH28]|uniref:Secreted protein n=1 Tax=Halomonas gemina TaxID=2945105 RepID=A0ABT0T469_9GAMM|nr:hypothetical protein [Halomonas gemina]MCL7941682.1 hypothetical protein [Halomonas gemina]